MANFNPSKVWFEQDFAGNENAKIQDFNPSKVWFERIIIDIHIL